MGVNSITTILRSVFLVAILTAFPALSQVKVFEYTGDVQTFIVPSGVSTITVDLYGASGGWNDYSGVRYDKYVPGKGGRLQATYPVHPGQKLYIYVGGRGGDASSGQGGAGGFNGGGNGNTSETYSGGGGGGASDIRIDGTGLGHRVLVAGGGGGAAYNYPDGGDHGGQGGGLIGADGQSDYKMEDESRGRGGSQKEGGLGGQWPSYDKAQDGSLGKGGDGPAGTSGTGGGGGYYGGGGGCWSGGGGGSSYSDRRATNVKHEQGVHTGDGKVVISMNCKMPEVTVSGPTSLAEGESITFFAKSNYGALMSWDHGVMNGVAFVPPPGSTVYTVSSSNPKECSYSVELTVTAKDTTTSPTIKNREWDDQWQDEYLYESEFPCQLKATTTNGIICEGETTTLIGHGGSDYLWSNGVLDNVPFVPPVGVNHYTVTSPAVCGTTEASVFVVVNRVTATANVRQNSSTLNAFIDLTPSGGTSPYTYIWKKDGIEYSRTEDINNLAPANYEVLIVDAIGCSNTQQFTITGDVIYNSVSPVLKAQLTEDQQFLDLTYNGYLDYVITNAAGNPIMSGTISNQQRINVAQLPAGQYQVCPKYNSGNMRCAGFVKN